MTSMILHILICTQMAMGAFDILYHHELTERLAWQGSQARELMLHAARNLIYAVLFVVLGWFAPHGLLALGLMALLAVEVVITLADFVEEDRTRRLPASERVTHALLALNYGAVLMLLFPILWLLAARPSALLVVPQGLWSWFMTASALGVVLFGLRDLAASLRARHLTSAPAGELAAGLPPRRRILVTGATGFVGRRLVESLIVAGHAVTVLARDAQKAARLGTPIHIVTNLDQIADDTSLDAIVNLAGESIAGGLWTRARRRRILESRVEMTEAVVALAARLAQRPAVLINASAIGWYGLNDEATLTEDSGGHDCFCRDICLAWEAAAEKAAALGVRVVRLRIGLVMGREGGLLGQLLMPFEFGAGGPIGSGRQWMSWIARDDLVRLIVFAIATPMLSGAVNGTAPAPARNRDFGRALGRALHRPALLPLPAAPLRWLGGDFARELLLGGQCVLPARALANGFVFRYPSLDRALAAALGRPGS